MEGGVELVDIDALKPYPGNPRRGDVGAISDSLRAHGQYRPIVVSRRTKHILAGNHTWLAAKRLRWDQIAVTWVDADANDERRIVLADNRTHGLGSYDDAALLALLNEVGLEGTGYSDFDVDTLEGLFEDGDLFGGEPRASRQQDRTKVRVDDYRILVDNNAFEPWQDALIDDAADQDGNTTPGAVETELRNRLGLHDEPAASPRKARQSPAEPPRGVPASVTISGAEMVPVDSLSAFPGNPRQGDIGAIAESLARNGQYRPIVVDRATRHVLVGNHTWQAAATLGWTEIAVVYIEVSELQAKRIVLADNRTAEMGGYDDASVLSMLQALDSWEGTGFTGDDVDELLVKVGEAPEPDKPNAKVAIGEWKFNVAREGFDRWLAAVRDQAGYLREDICRHIVSVLGLPDGAWVEAGKRDSDD